MWRRFQEEETPDYVEGDDYTNRQKELMADAILKTDARSELCRECGERGVETGVSMTQQQFTEMGQPIKDVTGSNLYISFPEIQCRNSHTWYQGEGAARGIGGENPILFEEHIQSRRRREIFPENGVPDPSIVSGIYNRAHPQGRKINSVEQRKKSGASWYR